LGSIRWPRMMHGIVQDYLIALLPDRLPVGPYNISCYSCYFSAFGQMKLSCCNLEAPWKKYLLIPN
jgi:hypothetical protein